MLELTKENFETEVLQNEGYTLVDFWSPSCEPCKALLPKVEAMESRYDKVRFAALNVSKARRVAIAQNVTGLPGIALYKDGMQQALISGHDATEAAVASMLETLN